MPKTVFGSGGDFYEDDPLFYLIPSDQAAAQFLVVLEDIAPSALEQLENEVLELATDSFIDSVGRGTGRRPSDFQGRADQRCEPRPCGHSARRPPSRW